MSVAFQLGTAFADAMDAQDSLAYFRERFFIPTGRDGKEWIYLCGHSLGLQPKTARDYIDQELHDWAALGVEGHFRAKNPWMPYHRLLSEQTATLVGAVAKEVVVMNSLTVNLHLMMISFYRPTVQRHKILVERGAFPSDQYAVKSQIRFNGFDPAQALIELTPREGETCIRDEDVQQMIERRGNEIALVLIGGVNYASGQVFDMKQITKLGHQNGCKVGFDLAHAAG
ncbi:MAG TPA: aminotransferase class V-fold PLP-dependent enzyme, partial [Candidatus Acidoferrum sp.]|nr:aminotransferase class V-fold PLP-dependent enzyme [Candidatus Acidoferrum sp.]